MAMDLMSFQKLLAFGVDRGVSDIHFEVGYPPHYRLHGELLGAIKVPPMTPADTETIAKIILSDRPDKIDFHRPFGEIDVSYSLPGRGRFRASIFRQRGTVGIVMRLIPFHVKSLDELHLPPVIAEIADARRGLILVTGLTGNGKSTTIAAMLRYLNETRHAHVITIEDPIEYLFEPGKCMIIQRELGSDTQSFKDALVAALRQDPDVIVVGEIRDRDTAETCLKAAETGHLVISAIHTPDTVSTVQRYVGMFDSDSADMARQRLGDVLQAVISLRLLVGKDGRGRLPATEIMRVTRIIREAIRTNRMNDIPDMVRKGRDLYNMQLFDQHLLDLVFNRPDQRRGRRLRLDESGRVRALAHHPLICESGYKSAMRTKTIGVAVLAAALAVGCGKKGDDQKAGGDEAAKTGEPAPAPKQEEPAAKAGPDFSAWKGDEKLKAWEGSWLAKENGTVQAWTVTGTKVFDLGRRQGKLLRADHGGAVPGVLQERRRHDVPARVFRGRRPGPLPRRRRRVSQRRTGDLLRRLRVDLRARRQRHLHRVGEEARRLGEQAGRLQDREERRRCRGLHPRRSQRRADGAPGRRDPFAHVVRDREGRRRLRRGQGRARRQGLRQVARAT